MTSATDQAASTVTRGTAMTSGAQLARKVGAEMIGTFALVFAGCGAMIYATGHISGAHFNPAVTVAFAAVGRFRWRQVPFYVAGPVVGALLGAWAYRAVRCGGEEQSAEGCC